VGGELLAAGLAGLGSLDAPLLQTVGVLRLQSNPALEQLALPALEEVSYDLILLGLDQLAQFELPLLRRIGEDVEISRGCSLVHLSMPSLAEVGEDLEFYQLHALPDVTLPLLASVDEDFEIYANDVLATFSFPHLYRIGEDLEIFDNPALSGVFSDSSQSTFPELTHVEEDFEFYMNHRLSFLSMPSLAVIKEDVIIFGNHHLREVHLPLVTEIAWQEGGGMLISDNYHLHVISLPSVLRLGDHTEDDQPDEANEQIILYTGAFPEEVPNATGRPVIVAHNPKLESLDLPALHTMATGLWVQSNALLKAVRLPSLQQFRGAHLALRWNGALAGAGALELALPADAPAPLLVNIGCNGDPPVCLQDPAPAWLQPWACGSDLPSCPDPEWAWRWCGPSEQDCTNEFYLWARENDYDFEENIYQGWLPARFSAYSAELSGSNSPAVLAPM
jgi:hypothetical protein